MGMRDSKPARATLPDVCRPVTRPGAPPIRGGCGLEREPRSHPSRDRVPGASSGRLDPMPSPALNHTSLRDNDRSASENGEGQRVLVRAMVSPDAAAETAKALGAGAPLFRIAMILSEALDGEAFRDSRI